MKKINFVTGFLKQNNLPSFFLYTGIIFSTLLQIVEAHVSIVYLEMQQTTIRNKTKNP